MRSAADAAPRRRRGDSNKKKKRLIDRKQTEAHYRESQTAPPSTMKKNLAHHPEKIKNLGVAEGRQGSSGTTRQSPQKCKQASSPATVGKKAEDSRAGCTDWPFQGFHKLGPAPKSPKPLETQGKGTCPGRGKLARTGPITRSGIRLVIR